jgi:hypothetical protein
MTTTLTSPARLFDTDREREKKQSLFFFFFFFLEDFFQGEKDLKNKKYEANSSTIHVRGPPLTPKTSFKTCSN